MGRLGPQQQHGRCPQPAGQRRRASDAFLARSSDPSSDPICEGPGCLSEEDGSVIVRDDLNALLQVLPQDIRQPLVDHPQRASLLEVVLDLGRRPEARFLGTRGGEFLRDAEITKEDLEGAVAALGDFGGDNRAGVEGTLHRISAIRNRKGAVVGLTCRVGRAVTGHVGLIRDVLDVPNSLLFLGRPGVGKTTVIRELARVLSDELHKRVVIVDTSNEIGGDGDVPHPAIGGARRMQVPDPSQQHKVMIIDEIGTEAEALACRTIAERGVQLIGTAHGQILENLIKNPTLSDLVGGICSVTLGDEEARARGTQKSILERKAPPTFPLVVEMRERASWVVHWVEDSVDCLLAGKVPIVQVRRRDGGKRVVEECRYSETSDESRAESPAATPSAASAHARGLIGGIEVADGIHTTVFDSLFGHKAAAFGSTYDAEGGRSAAAAADPYGWAARLRDIPDEDALQARQTLLRSLCLLCGARRARGSAGNRWGRACGQQRRVSHAAPVRAMMGMMDGSGMRGRSSNKFEFANGSTGAKKGKRRNSVGRAIPRRR
eukprot:scaffold6.g2607.t1